MATAPNKPSDDPDLSSRKPRRSIIRSLSWKRSSKRSKMEESEQAVGFEASGEASINVTVDSGEGVDMSGRSFNTTAGSGYGMSDEDTEDTVFDSSTSSNSKKRKKVGVWKTMKRFFSRKSGKGSKSQPQRSVSDPNLVHRPNERTDVAPLEQVEETPMDTETDAPPKKAISHDSLLSELRSKRRKNGENEGEISPRKQKASVEQTKSLDIDWKASPSHTPDKLLPGLNLSHDRIRVAPRGRRAPSRKEVSSVRHGIRDVTDGNVLPRSMSTGARIQGNVIVENSEEEMKALEEGKENLRKKLEEEQRQQQEKEERLKQLEIEVQKIEQEKENVEKNLQEQMLRQKEEEAEKQKELEYAIEQEKKSQEQEQENLKTKLEEEQRQRQKEKEEEEKQKELELAIEQEKKLQELEQDNRKKKLEEEERQRQKDKEEEEKRKQQEQKYEEEKRQKEKLEQERLKQEKLQAEALQCQKLEEETMEKERLEQEKQEQEKLDAQKRKESEELNQYNVNQTIDFSDLAESLRSSDNIEAVHGVEITEVEMKEEASDGKVQTLQDASDDVPAVEIQGVALNLNSNIEYHDNKEEMETYKEISDVQVSDTIDNEREMANDLVVSPLLTSGTVSESTSKDIRNTNEITIVEGSVESQRVSVFDKGINSENIVGEQHVIVEEPVIDKNDDITKITVQEDKSHKFSPPSSPKPTTPTSPVQEDKSYKFGPPSSPKSITPTSPVQEDKSHKFSPPSSPKSISPTSPVRSRRLVVETPEYQKPIMPVARTDDENVKRGSRGIQRQRPQSMHSRISPEVEKESKTQDDSNLGVAKLTQAFERSSRSKTVSYSDRRKKPDVLPKPKPAATPNQTKSLDRNYRFPLTAEISDETEISEQTNTKIQNNVIVLDKIPKKQVEEKKSVSPKKVPLPKPKTLPKPQPKAKPKAPNTITKTTDEGKENIKKTHNAQSSVTNGSVKMSTPDSTDSNVNSGESDLPSFWARRSVFSPEQKSNNSSQVEKTKEKHSPFIQLKTDICVVCGSKVYQMEKLKVKDNIIHRSCIKCSVCKRLLSVGNFIMSQNKIYCKPHEPHVAVSLATV